MTHLTYTTFDKHASFLGSDPTIDPRFKSLSHGEQQAVLNSASPAKRFFFVNGVYGIRQGRRQRMKSLDSLANKKTTADQEESITRSASTPEQVMGWGQHGATEADNIHDKTRATLLGGK